MRCADDKYPDWRANFSLTCVWQIRVLKLLQSSPHQISYPWVEIFSQGLHNCSLYHPSTALLGSQALRRPEHFDFSLTTEIKAYALSLPTGYNFPCFLSSADFFFKINFLKNSFRNTIRVSNSLDPDQARRFVAPDLCTNCLQSL